jgi:hypothetical protein
MHPSACPAPSVFRSTAALLRARGIFWTLAFLAASQGYKRVASNGTMVATLNKVKLDSRNPTGNHEVVGDNRLRRCMAQPETVPVALPGRNEPPAPAPAQALRRPSPRAVSCATTPAADSYRVLLGGRAFHSPAHPPSPELGGRGALPVFPEHRPTCAGALFCHEPRVKFKVSPGPFVMRPFRTGRSPLFRRKGGKLCPPV